MSLMPRTPRLLPATIGVIGALLAVKTTTLVRGMLDNGALTFLLTSPAAASEKAHGTPPPPKGHGAPPPPKPSGGDKGHGAPTAPAAATPPPEPPGPPPISEAERAVLLELRQRRQELESRESAMAGRESVLSAAEQKLGGRADELKALQKRLEGLEAERRRQEDAGWQGLVKLYETMKPREAATIFNELAMPTLLEVIDRMKEAKAASIMAAMTPDKARDVTTQLAKLRMARVGSPSASRPTPTGG